MKKFLIILFLILFILLPITCGAFDIEPSSSDKWYYEMETSFKLPDKLAHFYRSYGAVQFIKPELLFFLNIGYELYDERRGVSFSYKDLIVDTIGLISGNTFKNKTFNIYMDWNKREACIILIFTKGI